MNREELLWYNSETASGKTTELQAVLSRLWERNHPYADKMKDAGINPSDIRSPKDIEKLPFTTKQDLRPIIRLDGLDVTRMIWFASMPHPELPGIRPL